ncbi:methyltransferase domain-containing protein [Dactylosporangium sp. NBC_01737]|uniref:class I SAM-dependent methyltransferase n=1 Tax=Dactylosporangium sp. NBC_01737 TaxID=2975959 RepID=UPI002E126A54|nr:methyltransferase domain-containing protein [Dactylosporangium sp. NBC_01737]
MANEVWARGDAYEAYVGRWSRPVAARFLDWLAVPPGRRWLDVGCGTGALTGTVLAAAAPAEVTGVDASEAFLALARSRLTDRSAARFAARFIAGDARALPVPDASADVVVSGLTLNFVPEPATAVAEFARAVAPGGLVAAYVWDYADGMAMMRHFWDAATSLDPAAAALDEGRRFSICSTGALSGLWSAAGLSGVTTRPIDTTAVFVDFDDYWTPFLGGTGPAPGYVASLSEEHRATLRDLLRERLPRAADGSIPLLARALAVRGTAA